MPTRTAEAIWKGTLREGHGTMKMATGGFNGPFTSGSRFEEAEGTNPEELLAAAHAGCFSMALSADLGRAGFTATRIHTTAQVTLEKVDGKQTITGIKLVCKAEVPGIDDETLRQTAEGTKTGCPVSRALSAVPITLELERV